MTSTTTRRLTRQTLAAPPRWLLAVVVLCLTMAIVLVFWAALPTGMGENESADYLNYYAPVAHNLLAGEGLVTNAGQPAIRYPPGYPLVLAGLFGLSALTGIPESLILLAFTLACISTSAVCVLLLARTLWGPYLALVAALSWASYPLALWSTKQPNSEIPFIPLLYGAVLLVWAGLAHRRLTWPLALAAGLLIGFAMLIRPIAVGAGLVLALGIWIAGRELPTRRRLLLVGALLLGNALMVLPWQVWVYSQTGQVILLSTGGAPSIRDGLTFAVNLKSYREGVKVTDDVAELSTLVLERGRGVDSTGALLAIVAEETQERPLAMARLIGMKAARSWYATDSQRLETPIMILQLLYFIPIVLGTWGSWRLAGPPRIYALLAWLLAGYFWAMTIMVLSIARYTYPVMGLLFVLLPGLLVLLRPQSDGSISN